MDMFRNEKTQIEKKIYQVVPQLEDLGCRGNIINKNLHKVKNAVKSPKSLGGGLFGSGMSKDEVEYDLKAIKGELDVYGEKASILIGDLTAILTQIGYRCHQHVLIVGTRRLSSGPLGPRFQEEHLVYMFSRTPLSLLCYGYWKLVPLHATVFPNLKDVLTSRSSHWCFCA